MVTYGCISLDPEKSEVARSLDTLELVVRLSKVKISKTPSDSLSPPPTNWEELYRAGQDQLQVERELRIQAEDRGSGLEFEVVTLQRQVGALKEELRDKYESGVSELDTSYVPMMTLAS